MDWRRSSCSRYARAKGLSLGGRPLFADPSDALLCRLQLQSSIRAASKKVSIDGAARRTRPSIVREAEEAEEAGSSSLSSPQCERQSLTLDRFVEQLPKAASLPRRPSPAHLSTPAYRTSPLTASPPNPPASAPRLHNIQPVGEMEGLSTMTRRTMYLILARSLRRTRRTRKRS